MQHVVASETINVDQSVLWPLVADVTQIAHWHPTIASVDLLSSKPSGLQAARRCHFKDGTSVREDLVALTEGRAVRFRLSEFSVPMKRLELQIETAPAAQGATQTTFTLHYEVKFGLLGRFLGATIMRMELSKMVRRLLTGLSAYAEKTGEKRVAQAA